MRDASHWDVMKIQDLPYPDPGEPDARSGPRFLWWLFRNQLGGQFSALAWGLLHFVAVSGLPFGVGFAVQAVVDRSGGRLALAGGLMVLCGVAIALGDTHAAPGRGHQLDHGRRPRPATAGPQDRPAGLGPDTAGRGR